MRSTSPAGSITGFAEDRRPRLDEQRAARGLPPRRPRGYGSAPGVGEAIVVGTNGSETARRAVAEAARLAGALGAEVHVVSAYEGSTAVAADFVVPPAGED